MRLTTTCLYMPRNALTSSCLAPTANWRTAGRSLCLRTRSRAEDTDISLTIHVPLTITDSQDFLNRIGLEEDTVLTVLDGLKDVLGDKGLAVLNFLQFMLVYHWLTSTVQAYGAKLS